MIASKPLDLDNRFYRFNRERLKQEAAMGIFMLMEQQKPEMKKADLARLLGKKPPEITKMLSGYQNFSLETLANVCAALGRAISFRFHEGFDRVSLPVDQVVSKPVWSADNHNTLDFGTRYRAVAYVSG